MRCVRKIRVSLLILVMMVMTIGQTAWAADTAYTYTVRLYAGNQGVITGEGITAPEGADVVRKGDYMEVSGLHYSDTVYITPQDAAKVTDERYHVKGVRRSGRDNSEATAATFEVSSDRDYVIAYAVSGALVRYTVNYQDAAGNALLPSDTYYGNPGERQYVSARYVDGYLPQAYNLVMTLTANEAGNVFTFQYTPVETPAAVTPPAAETPGTAAPGAAGAGAAGAGAGAAAVPGAAAGADAGADAGVGGDVPVAVPDDAVPQADTPEDMVDLDDEEVPMANMPEKTGGRVVSYLPVYIGIGAAAVLALVGMAFFLKKRRRVPADMTRELTREMVQRRSDDERQP